MTHRSRSSRATCYRRAAHLALGSGSSGGATGSGPGLSVKADAPSATSIPRGGARRRPCRNQTLATVSKDFVGPPMLDTGRLGRCSAAQNASPNKRQ